jgi:PAS domain S-box-containing protein
MSDESPIRVLLVDDDEEAYHLTRAILDRIPSTRFDLDYAPSFEDGVDLVARGVHDVYLVDYVLGERSGIDLVRRARASLNHAPMILLTGKGRYAVDVEAMGAGVSDYLEKGRVEPDLVERSIRYAMDRARAEAALRDSEARHRSMFDHLPIGLYRTSVEGALLDANPSLVQLLGHPDRDTLELDYARHFFVNPVHRDTFLERLERFGILRGFESELKRPDGRVVRVRTAARSHRDEQGATLYIEGSVEDVSEEHEARDLHGRAARFSWIFGRSGLAIVLVDLEGTILDANPAFLRAFDYETEAIQGRPLVDLADACDRESLVGELARVASGQSDTSEAERRLVATDGAVLWARTRTGLVRDASGRPDHVMIVLEDVAEA